MAVGHVCTVWDAGGIFESYRNSPGQGWRAIVPNRHAAFEKDSKQRTGLSQSRERCVLSFPELGGKLRFMRFNRFKPLPALKFAGVMLFSEFEFL
jgi:hypothetical protein